LYLTICIVQTQNFRLFLPSHSIVSQLSGIYYAVLIEYNSQTPSVKLLLSSSFIFLKSLICSLIRKSDVDFSTMSVKLHVINNFSESIFQNYCSFSFETLL